MATGHRNERGEFVVECYGATRLFNTQVRVAEGIMRGGGFCSRQESSTLKSPYYSAAAGLGVG